MRNTHTRNTEVHTTHFITYDRLNNIKQSCLHSLEILNYLVISNKSQRGKEEVMHIKSAGFSYISSYRDAFVSFSPLSLLVS